MSIYRFPDKKKRSKKRSQVTTDILVEKILQLAKEYDPKKDPAIKAFKRRIRNIER